MMTTNNETAPPTTTTTTTTDGTDATSSHEDMVEVSWSGKKILIARSKLDEWFHGKAFEEQVDYCESHPELLHNNTNTNKKIAYHDFGKNRHAAQLPPPVLNDYVLVHWSGDKELLLRREQLDDWYHGSYESHVDYVKKHPECVLK
jgi:hypothetical protein